MSSRNTGLGYTKSSIYRSTTLGLTLQKTVESFTSQGHIPEALQSEIMEKFDGLMCELLSTGTAEGGVGSLKGKLFYPEDENKVRILDQNDQFPIFPMSPIGIAKIEGSQVTMYRYLKKCYEFLIKDATIYLDTRGQVDSNFDPSDPKVLKLKSDKLKIVALQTSDTLLKKVESRKRKDRS